MSILVLFLAVIFLFYVVRVKMDKPSKKIVSLYGGFFFFSLILSTVGYKGMYIPKFNTYILLLLSFISFIIGYSSIKIRKENCDLSEKLSLDMEAITHNKIIWAIAIISCLYVLSKIKIYASSIALYASVGHMRTAFYDGELYGSDFPYVNLFLADLFYFFIPLFSYMTFKKRNLLWLIVGVFLFGYSVLGGGRFEYVFIFLAFVLTELIFKISKLKTRKLIPVFLIAGALIFGILLIVTNARKGFYETDEDTIKDGAESTMETMVSYSCGSVVAFDRIVNNNYVAKAGGYKLGRLTLSSPDLLLDYVTKHILGFSIKPALGDIAFKQEDFIEIGPGMEWNALYTASLFYYLDFDFLGCMIFPFLLGLIFRFFIKCLYRLPTFSMLVLVFLFFRVTIFSVMDYGFVFAFDCVLILLMYNNWNSRLKKQKKAILLKRA